MIIYFPTRKALAKKSQNKNARSYKRATGIELNDI